MTDENIRVVECMVRAAKVFPDAFAMPHLTVHLLQAEVDALYNLCQGAKEKKVAMQARIACPDCSKDRGYYVMMQFQTAGFYLCTVCSRELYPMEAMKMANVDRSDLEDPTGKYAMIRPNSGSGHSPSTRYKTEAKAIEAAKRVVLSQSHPQTFEVVKIVARVATQNEARVIRVR